MSDQTRQVAESVARHTADVAAGVVTVGTLFDLLPGIAALISIVWMIIRIYETHTVQRMLGRAPTRPMGEDD